MSEARIATVLTMAAYGMAGLLVALWFGRDMGVMFLVAAVIWLCWDRERAHDRTEHALGRIAALERYLAAPEAQTTEMPAWTPPASRVRDRYRHIGGHRA